MSSIADALQFISYYHPADYVRHLARAYEIEESPAAKDAIGQILLNSRMAAMGRRPICQDTGTAHVFLKIGMGVRFERRRSLSEMINSAVRRAYLDVDNPLRATLLFDPLFNRSNTRDNTPAVIHAEIIEGDTLTITVAAKGGGAENRAAFAALEPGDSVVDWVVDAVSKMGAGWCPPGLIGIGVGGSPEKAMLMAKESLFEPIDMFELLARGPTSAVEEMRVELFHKINALGIGAQGLGGLTTVVDVKISTFASHAASKPVGLVPQCAANRHVTFVLDGSGAASFEPPRIEDWPDILLSRTGAAVRRVDLDSLTKEEVANWTAGQRLLLSGRIVTGRDAAHERFAHLIQSGRPLPVDLKNRAIYYVGPVDAVRDEAVGPAGPTTATRMDRYVEQLLASTGLLVMVGKAERGSAAIEAIRRHGAAYLIAVGGAAYLVSKAIRSARLLAFEDLGMEAVREFDLVEMPVTVAVDSRGTSIHETGPAHWRGLAQRRNAG